MFYKSNLLYNFGNKNHNFPKKRYPCKRITFIKITGYSTRLPVAAISDFSFVLLPLSCNQVDV